MPNDSERTATSSTPRSESKDPSGYSSLAELMGEHSKAAIFRKFGSLAMLNLMHLQAELVEIESDLIKLRTGDETSEQKDMQTSSGDFVRPDSSTSLGDEQLLMTQKSARTLEQYYSLMLKCSQANQLRRPKDSDLKFLRDWLQDEEEGDRLQNGDDSLKAWHEDVTNDLVAVGRSSLSQGGSLRWFGTAVATGYHCIRRWLWTFTCNLWESWAMSLEIPIVDTVVTLVPLLGVLWLQLNVDNAPVRYWIAVCLAGGTGLALKILTNSNRKEILAGMVFCLTGVYIYVLCCYAIRRVRVWRAP